MNLRARLPTGGAFNLRKRIAVESVQLIVLELFVGHGVLAVLNARLYGNDPNVIIGGDVGEEGLVALVAVGLHKEKIHSSI